MGGGRAAGVMRRRGSRAAAPAHAVSILLVHLCTADIGRLLQHLPHRALLATRQPAREPELLLALQLLLLAQGAVPAAPTVLAALAVPPAAQHSVQLKQEGASRPSLGDQGEPPSSHSLRPAPAVLPRPRPPRKVGPWSPG